MVNFTVTYLDSHGNPVATPEEATYTVVGNMRSRKGGSPEKLVGGVWVPLVVPLPPPSPPSPVS